jgi:hypothetical protein
VEQPAIGVAELAVAPLDLLRLRLLKRFGKRIRGFLTNRELRVAWLGTLAVGVAFACTLCAPLWLLALGPIVLGVPHLLSDLRYLVVRPGYHRRARLWLVIGVPVVAAGLGAGAAVGLLGGVGASLCARTTRTRRALGAAAASSLVAATVALGAAGNLVFAHVHNAVAVACWVLWRQRRTWSHAIVLGALVLGSALIASGGVDSVVAALPGFDAHARGLGWSALLPELAPGVRGLAAQRLVLLFAFAQSVHYAVWLRLVPDEDRAQPTPRSFRASLRALRADFGAWPLRIACAAALLIAAWALRDVRAARAGYLRLALFHGHLEVAALGLLLLEGTLPWRAGRFTSR